VTQPDAARPGRRPTLDDVAARAGVSRTLASLIIRGIPGPSATTGERVLRVAKELGYRPDTRARLLARQHSRLLGVVFGMQHAFHAEVVDGLYAAAEAAGYELVLSGLTPSRDPRRAVETLLDYRCEALILLGPEDHAAWIAELAERVPVLVVGYRVKQASVDIVRTADHEGVGQAVDHLVALGHWDIVHVDGGPGLVPSDRRRGYRSAMRRHGLGEHARVVPGGKTEEAGALAATLLRGGALPTAVLAYNDDSALGLIDAFIRAGVTVPGDVSVVGYDDSWLSRLPHVSLTTVGQDAHRMASLAVERALARLSGEQIPGGDLVLPPHLVVRGTTAPARDEANEANERSP
jgi:DNA-binding LacI/PurR family transcriptional regulator